MAVAAPSTMNPGFPLAPGLDPSVVGTKAATLGTLRGAGLEVPPGLAIPARTIDVGAAVRQVLDSMDGPFAVRSSALAEDGARRAHAGEYTTLLSVPSDPGALAEAMTTVAAGLAGSVLVMPMVPALAAGIAFTMDPVSGERRTLVDAVNGLGAELAAGRVTGERWVVAGEVTCLQRRGVLVEEEVRSIARVAADVETTLRHGVDMEWALDGGRVIVLQARPITAAG